MKSSVVTIAFDAVPEADGFVVATKTPLPANLGNDGIDIVRHVLHVEPGRDPKSIPGVIQVVVDGNKVDWIPDQIALLWPHGSQYVLEAEWLDADGTFRRTKIIDVPTGITPIATNIVGHLWAGDA